MNEPWDQDRFERLLAEWIAACDQPFDAVEKPELHTLLQYTHRSPEHLDIPSAATIKKRIMDLSDEYVEELAATIKVRHIFNISLSLDAWTSSNGFAFLATVMHYVSDNWRLEEILIGFEELIGEHSGKNMAEVLWHTMDVYGLIGRVIAINCDNASSNDTLLAEIESLCHEHGIRFSAKQARMRCVPHTIHLSALELLSALGVISKADQKAASSGSRSNYQESVTAPVNREHDDELVGQDDPPEEASDDATQAQASMTSTTTTSGATNPASAASSATYGHLHQAIQKLRKIIRAVRASPQRRQAWLEEVRRHPELVKANTSETALMLILDVPTRWSSTHQMLRESLL
ncbi:hypothetical protein LXA43DRAFT_977757 [Ganoderma leucocontextum]|nr:hypothetical protein LXA43DRAFT_977757 [Ganoderma leucocontextum]